ncbi:unnamed protein product, partial [Nesidiocoris tenuis]
MAPQPSSVLKNRRRQVSLFPYHQEGFHNTSVISVLPFRTVVSVLHSLLNPPRFL